MTPNNLKTLFKIFDNYRTDKKDRVFQITLVDEDTVYVQNISAPRRTAGATSISKLTPEQKAERAAKARSARSGVTTHCKRGHEWTPENTLVYQGVRSCKACRRLSYETYSKRRKLS